MHKKCGKNTALALMALFILFFLAGFTSTATGTPPPLDNWTSTNTFPDIGNLTGIADNGTVIVAVGVNGALLTSLDGVAWNAGSIGSAPNLRGIAYGAGPGVFAAVGDNGAFYYSSDNAVTWSPGQTNPLRVTANMVGVTYGGGIFVAVGQNGAIFTSSDGKTWTKSYAGITTFQRGVAYGNSTFVMVGESGTIHYSSDGVTWNRGTSRLPNATFYGVAFGNGIFVAVGTNQKIIFSRDNGNTWAEATSPYKISGAPLRAVTYVPAEDIFVAVGDGGRMPVSLPGNPTAWARTKSSVAADLKAVSNNGTLAYAVGTGSTIITSPDTIAWNQASLTTGPLTAAAFGGGLFVVVGSNGSILTSPAITSVAATWTGIRAATSPNFEGVAYGNGAFVAVGQGKAVQTSPDGFTWTNQITATTNAPNLLGVTFGDDLFVAVGAGTGTGPATIITSPDGITWTARTSHTAQTITSVTYGSGTFVAVGNQVTLTSTDGITWTAATSLYAFESVAYGSDPGLFVAVTVSGHILTSTNGSEWTKVRSVPGALYGVTYGVANGAGTFVAVGAGGAIYSSTDGALWSRNKSKTVNDLEAATFSSGNGTFLAVGSLSTILQSGFPDD